MILITPSTASATACQFSDHGPIPVVYFGGNKASAGQVAAWASAAQGSKYGSQFAFEGNALLTQKSNGDAVRTANNADIQSCVDRINSPGFKGPVIIVGHSDGGWVINDIVRRTKPENRSKIKFVSLDGYAANGPDFSNVDVQCWTSYMTEKQGNRPQSCADITQSAKSLYTDEMAKCKPGSCHVLPQQGCTTNWCLHFRLINGNVPTNVGNGNYDRVGYTQVDPPLQFLDSFAGAVPTAVGTRATTPGRTQ